MINIVVVGLTQTKLANLANTKVKREVLVAFINFSPLPVVFTPYLAVGRPLVCMNVSPWPKLINVSIFRFIWLLIFVNCHYYHYFYYYHHFFFHKS